MQPTQIKINKNANSQPEQAKPLKNILNLNGLLNRPPSNNRWKKYLWLLLVLVIIEGGAIAWLYFLKPVSPYFKFLPQDTAVSSYFNQTSLLTLIKSHKSAQPDWPPLAWSANALKDFFSSAKIDQPEQLLTAFSDQMALAILPQNSKASAAWLILSSIKAPSDIFSQTRDKTEERLKQNFNLINESYRQIKISQVQSLNKDKQSLFYAVANGYFILTNDLSLAKSTIDKIIK